MGLVNRLAGLSDPEGSDKIAVLTFHAMLVELANGEVTQQNIIDYFQLSAEDQTELSWLLNQYNSQPNAAAKAQFIDMMRSLFVLAEQEVPGYTTNPELVARINRI